MTRTACVVESGVGECVMGCWVFHREPVLPHAGGQAIGLEGYATERFRRCAVPDRMAAADHDARR